MSFISSAQESNTQKNGKGDVKNFKKGWVSSNAVLALQGGMNYYDLTELNNQLSAKYGGGFSNRNVFVGFSVSESTSLNRKYNTDSHLDFLYMLPTTNQYTDSLKYKLGGFYIGFDIGNDLFPKTKAFDLLLGLGFNAGRMKILRQDLTVSEDFYKYKNPYFAPKLTLEARVIIAKRLSLSVRGELQYDVTNSKWKRKQASLELLKGSKATGYNLHATLGWNLSKVKP